MTATAALGDVCDVAMGQAPKGASYNEQGDGYPLLAGAGDFGDEQPEPKKFTTSPTRISAIGDLILCIRATIGDLNWSDREYCLGRGVAGLRPREGVLDPSYLWHYIKSNRHELASRGTGSTFKQVSRLHIEEWLIPLPLLSEQKRIAAILDKADAIRRKRQQAIDLTDQLLRSVFLDMFGDPGTNPKGWPTGCIGDLAETVNYGTSAKAGTVGSFPVLRMNNITYSGGWDFSSLKYMDLEEKDLDKFMVRPGDLLFNRTNSRDLVGKTAVFESNDEFAFAGYLIRVRVNEHVTPEYVSGYLNSEYGKTLLRHMCKNIVGMANINAQELRAIKLPIPPIELQHEYKTILTTIQSRRAVLEESLASTQELASALSQRAFHGDLAEIKAA